MSRQQTIYLCEVIVRNHFAGRRFILRGKKDLIDFGLRPESVKIKSRQRGDNVLFGIRFTPINESAFNEDEAKKAGYTENWKDISLMFIRYPSRFRLRSKPIIGHILMGEYKDEYVALFSLSDIGNYFPVESIRKSIIDKTIYSGIAWRYAEDYQEAETFYQGDRKQYDMIHSVIHHRPKQRGWNCESGVCTSGFQYALVHLQKAKDALTKKDYLEAIVNTHKAVAEYQRLAKRRIRDSTLAYRFEQLAACVAPKTDKNLLDSVNIAEANILISKIINQLKRKQ